MLNTPRTTEQSVAVTSWQAANEQLTRLLCTSADGDRPLHFDDIADAIDLVHERLEELLKTHVDDTDSGFQEL